MSDPVPKITVSYSDAKNAVARLLVYLGEDWERDGLQDTPGRVVKSLEEMCAGYRADVGALFTLFDEPCDEMVLLKDIPFSSLCEHHLMPFMGVAHVAYVPSGGKVVGISKLARLVDVYAKRLQVQERMTNQIAVAIWANLRPLGAGVVVEATHGCMSCRGVNKAGCTLVTSKLMGVFRDGDPRAEFMSLIGK